jgi:hypothetical protein
MSFETCSDFISHLKSGLHVDLGRLLQGDFDFCLKGVTMHFRTSFQTFNELFIKVSKKPWLLPTLSAEASIISAEVLRPANSGIQDGKDAISFVFTLKKGKKKALAMTYSPSRSQYHRR